MAAQSERPEGLAASGPMAPSQSLRCHEPGRLFIVGCRSLVSPDGRAGAGLLMPTVELAQAQIVIAANVKPGAPRSRMQNDNSELDRMQNAYKVAVEEWIAAIKTEEELASVNHSIAEVDKWEDAHFKEDEIRNKVKAAKRQYEDALRERFFGF
jgi:hypothetical protein